MKEKDIRIDDINITSSQIEDSYKELNDIEKIFKSKKGEMYQTFLDFKDKGLYDIQGKKITVKNNAITDEGWNELYTAAQIYRNKKFETMRYIFIDPYFNKIRDQMTLSSYLPNLCIMTMGNQTTSEVISHAEKNNLYVIACHNHPSGNVDPSDDDINSTNMILRSMTNNHGETRFLGHIILDHNSYSYFSPRSGWHKGTIEENINISEEQHNSTIENKLNLNKIDGPRALALFSSSEFFNDIVKEVNESDNYSDNYIPVIYCDTSFKIKSFKYYSKSTFLKNKESIKELFINDAIETGSNFIYPVFTEQNLNKIKNKERLEKKLLTLIKNNIITDASIADSYPRSIVNTHFIDGGNVSKYFDLSNKINIKSTFERKINEDLFANTVPMHSDDKIVLLLNQKKYLEKQKNIFEDTYTIISKYDKWEKIEHKLTDNLTDKQKELIIEAAENFNIRNTKEKNNQKGRGK